VPEQNVSAPSCDEVVIKIGQYGYITSLLRRKIMGMLRDLWGTYKMRRMFGEFVTLPEAVMQFQMDLRDGKLKVQGTKVCSDERCIDLVKLLKTLDEYYDAHKEKMRYVRMLEWCKTEVE